MTLTQNTNQDTPSHPMQQYHDMLQTILDQGALRPNRTGVDTLFVPGMTLKFDMDDGFPAITTKKLAFKAAKGELFGFFRGYQSAAQFRELGCKVWDGNANETPSWLNNAARKGEDDLGRIYGAQYTDWRDWRSVNSQAQADALEKIGYTLIAHDPQRSTWVYRRGINQLENALRDIMTNPTSRRIIVTAWRPDELDQMALPPCHMDYQFLVDPENGWLHLCFFQRSFDTALAFNVTIGALFLHIMARLSGLKPKSLTQFIGDAHIYANHIEGVKEMLTRSHFAQPTLNLGSIATLQSLDEINGVFERLDPNEISLEGYQSHPAIKLPMAV